MLEAQKKMKTWFYALLSLPATAMGFGLSVQISALSWILSTKYGLDIHEIGIVWAAGPIAGIIAQPIVGAVSDKLWFMGGRRRPWVILGGILTGLMLLALPNLEIVQKVFGMAGEECLLAIAVAVALTLDLAINVSFNPTRSLVADCTSKEQRSTGFTWMQTVSGTFGVLAYLIAVIWGNEFLIYVGAILAVLFTVLPIFFIEEPRELNAEEESAVKQEKTSIKDMAETILPLSGFLIYGIYVICGKLMGLTVGGDIFGLDYVETACVVIEILAIIAVLLNLPKSTEDNNQFQKILLAHSFTWWGVQTMNIYMFFYVATKIIGIENQEADINSWAFLVRDLVGAILPVLVLNVIASKTGMSKTHTGSILLMALGYALIYLFGANIVVFFASLCLVGIGWASLVSLPFAMMSERINQNKMGLYMGVFNLSVVLPQLVASFKMGEVIRDAASNVEKIKAETVLEITKVKEDIFINETALDSITVNTQVGNDVISRVTESIITNNDTILTNNLIINNDTIHNATKFIEQVAETGEKFTFVNGEHVMKVKEGIFIAGEKVQNAAASLNISKINEAGERFAEITTYNDNVSIIFAICAVCLTISGVLWIAVKDKK